MAQIKAIILTTQNLCHRKLLTGLVVVANGNFDHVFGQITRYSFLACL